MKQSLDKNYLYQLVVIHTASGFLAWLFFVVPLAIAILEDAPVLGILLLIAVPVLFIGLVYLFAYLWWKNYSYELKPETFEKHYGVISLRNTNIPYERIQNINISRPLISRIFGLSQLQIQTAGNSGVVGAEGRLPGLKVDVAEKVRDELIRRAKSQQSSHGKGSQLNQTGGV